MSVLKLYKKTSTGKITEWIGTVEGATFHVDTGYTDGKKVRNSRACKGKNKGRANATTDGLPK